MTRKLENLDFATLDRAAGGCRPVSQNAHTNGPAFKLANKLGALVDNSGMNLTTLPASFADIHEALPALTAEMHEAQLPDVQDLIPAAHDLFANVGADDVPQVLDSTQLGSGLGDLPSVDDLPINWCGTPDQNNDAWDDGDQSDMLDTNGADATDLATHDLHVGDFGSVIGHAVEQPVAAPEMRDHRMATLVEADRMAHATVIDHRGEAAAAASQPTIRDQR